MAKRVRRIGSIKTELLKKSREAALAAVQIFNNPNISFKAESYVVLMIIAWTYLLHSYYREKKIEYRYFTQNGKKRKFHVTKHGAYKFWELEACINRQESPIDKDTSNNLRFLIGLRHEIEHQMTTRIDDVLSAKFQACCLNYNEYLKKLFGDKFSIEKHLSFSLQFSTISDEQKDLLGEYTNLPQNIQSYVTGYEALLSEEEFLHPHYAYRILFVPKTANRKGQADKVIEFVKSDSPLVAEVNKDYVNYVVMKETEKKKYRPGAIVKIIQELGFTKFNMTCHTRLWQALDAKNSSKGFGTLIGDGMWYWYEAWLNEVKKHCSVKGDQYR